MDPGLFMWCLDLCSNHFSLVSDTQGLTYTFKNLNSPIHSVLFSFSYVFCFNIFSRDFPGGLVVKNSPAKQGTCVQSLVWEDPTCHRTAKPVDHNYRSRHTLEPTLFNKKRHHKKKPVYHS